MGEPREIRIKRLAMRSMRRGIKEMDVILSAFAEARLGALDDNTLSDYERLLNENDHDLYAWVSGTQPVPEQFEPLISAIKANLPRI